MPAGRPPKYETPKEMQDIIDLYFLACRFNNTDDEALIAEFEDERVDAIKLIDDKYPTVSGLAYALGMSTEALRNYEEKDEFLATVKRAKQRIEKTLEQRLFGPAAAGTIFNLKNNFNWKDKTETEHSGIVGISDLTDEQLDSRLAAIAESQSKD
jgi:hypothetical protein